MLQPFGQRPSLGLASSDVTEVISQMIYEASD